MNTNILNIRIQNRHSTIVEWEEANPILLDGEIAIVKFSDNTTKLKIGDGINNFKSLEYVNSSIEKDIKEDIHEISTQITWGKF